jgi:tetratricopeptide (TPR) repeat protein
MTDNPPAGPGTTTPGGDLLAELKRRGVVRAVVAYALFAFAALQVSEPIMHGLRLPDAWLTVLVVLLGLGFPLTAALSWAFDLTRRGIVRTDEAVVRAPGTARRTRLMMAAVTVLSAALGAGLSWWALRPPPAPVDADGRVSVAVADFANQTGEPALDALSGLLITSLEQSKRLKVLTRGRMLELLRQAGEPRVERIDEATARLVGGKAGVRALLLASIQKLGGSYIVELRALDTQKDHYLFTLREQAGDQTAILPLIDRLSEQVRLRLRERDAEVQGSDIQVAAAITPNLDAYRHYFKGKELRARLDDFGAEKEYREALRLEPGFALAQLELSLIALMWAQKDMDLYREAVRNAGRLPEKERELVLAWGELQDGRLREADARAKRLANRYPEDSQVLYAASQASLEPADTVSLIRRALALSPDWAEARLQLSWDAVPLGLSTEMLQEALAAERAQPGGPAATAVGVYRLGTGDAAGARADFERALRAAPVTMAGVGLAYALILSGDHQAARAVAEGAPGGANFFLHASVDMQEGRVRAAARRFEQEGQKPGPGGDLFRGLAATLHLARGDRGPCDRLDAAARARVVGEANFLMFAANAEERRRAIEARGAGSSRARLIEASALREAGDAAGAVRALGPVEPRSCGTRAWLLGMAQSDLGHHEEAVALLRRVEPCALIGGDGFTRLYQVAAGRVRIARGLAALGKVDESRKVLEQQLAQWKDADPDLIALVEAKALCRELKCRTP